MSNENNNIESEEVTQLDLIYESHDKVDALIGLLIEKGVISQKEYETKLNDLYEDLEEE